MVPRQPSSEAAAADADGGAAGGGTSTVLLTDVSAATGRIADRFLLREQYLHKALLLVVSEAGGVVSAVVLNRPTASIMKFKTVGGKTRRRFPYCGGAQLNGQLWLHHRSELGGDAIGESGLYALPQETVAKVLHDEAADASDFFLASAVVQFAPGELGGMLAAGEVRVLPPADRPDDLWPRVWALTDENGDVSDGTGVCAREPGARRRGAPPRRRPRWPTRHWTSGASGLRWRRKVVERVLIKPYGSIHSDLPN